MEKKKPFPSFFTKFMIQNMNDGNYQIILERTNIVNRMLWQTTISSRFLLYVLARMDHYLEDVKYEVAAVQVLHQELLSSVSWPINVNWCGCISNLPQPAHDHSSKILLRHNTTHCIWLIVLTSSTIFFSWWYMINSKVQYVGHFRSFVYGGSTAQCFTWMDSNHMWH